MFFFALDFLTFFFAKKFCVFEKKWTAVAFFQNFSKVGSKLPSTLRKKKRQKNVFFLQFFTFWHIFFHFLWFEKKKNAFFTLKKKSEKKFLLSPDLKKSAQKKTFFFFAFFQNPFFQVFSKLIPLELNFFKKVDFHFEKHEFLRIFCEKKVARCLL